MGRYRGNIWWKECKQVRQRLVLFWYSIEKTQCLFILYNCNPAFLTYVQPVSHRDHSTFSVTLYFASLIFLDYWTSFYVANKNQWLCMILQLVNYCLNVFVFLKVCSIVHIPVLGKTLCIQLLSLFILRTKDDYLYVTMGKSKQTGVDTLLRPQS